MAEGLNRLAGRRIVITGAAAGMGEGVARLFAAEGARCVLLDVQKDKLDAVAAETGQVARLCDVSNEDQVAEVMDFAAETLGGIDGLLNVAGVLLHKPVVETSMAEFNRLIAINLAGPFLTCRAAIPYLQQADAATIVNVASLSSVRAVPLMTSYSATKAGLVAFSEALSGEVGPKIRVNAISPGVIRTAMTTFMWGEGGPGDEGLAKMISVGRAGEPEDVAQAALFLTSHESAFVNATNIIVSGGHFGTGRG